MSSWMPNPSIAFGELASGSSLVMPVNLRGMTLSVQPPFSDGTRRISGAVWFSRPGQNGQLGSNDGIGFRARCTISSCGCLISSLATNTHSLVNRSWRNSGMTLTPTLFSMLMHLQDQRACVLDSAEVEAHRGAKFPFWKTSVGYYPIWNLLTGASAASMCLLLRSELRN